MMPEKEVQKKPVGDVRDTRPEGVYHGDDDSAQLARRSKSRAQRRRLRQRRRRRKVLLIILLIAAVFSSQYFWYGTADRKATAADITAIEGEQLHAETLVSIPEGNPDFLPGIFDRSARIISGWDAQGPGERSIKILVYTKTGYMQILAPKIKVVDGGTRVYSETEPGADEITVWDFINPDSVPENTKAELVSVPEAPEFNAGKNKYVFACVIRLDGREIPCTLYVEDKTPPVIEGVHDINVQQGDAIMYKDGVSVTDNYDPNVKLEIESEAIASQPGAYPVTYRAKDESGNEAVANATVSVLTTEEVFVNEKADEVLAQIITDGMTLREKATAIFWWVRNNMRYVATTNESDPLLGAYEAFTHGGGHCFTYYAVSELLLTRAGVPNLPMERPPEHPVTHFWNLVQVEEGWFHFDAYPTYVPLDTCLFTDSQAVDYSKRQEGRRTGYYSYVKENYPPVVP